MKLAFVFSPYSHKRFAENLRVVDEDFGVFPPINLAYAAAIAERAGHQVFMIDAMAEGISLDQTIGRLRGVAPDAVGFYFSTYMFWDTHAWAEAIKKALGVPILAGGINLLLYPRESLSHGVIDYAVSGQSVDALPALLRAIEEGSDPDLPGVAYRRGEEVICHPPVAGPVDFDSYPLPARHLLPNTRYYSITSQLRNFTIMVTSMGCHQRCTFCPIHLVPLSTRSPTGILDEMEECLLRYGVREIDIFDPDFPFRRRRAEEICNGILARGLRFEWSCRACVDSVDADLLRLMHAAGCRKVYLGLETPCDELLQRMDKKLSVDRVQEVIDAAKRVGIRPLGFFMTGVPGETRQTLLRTIRYSLSLGLEYAQYSRTIAKPGTQLSRDLAEALGYDYWREFVRGNAEERRLESPWTSLSEGEIAQFTKIAYLVFYYRPQYVLRALWQVRSTDELLRSLRTALRMLLDAARGSRER